VFIALAVAALGARASAFVPLGIALLVGALDDIFDLSARVRLAGEVAIGVAAALVVPSRGPLGFLANVAFVIVLLNAVNLLDGLDGLASGVAAVAAFGFAAAFAFEGDWTRIALALLGALVGFLFWNRPPARIYLGDAGSYLVGTTLAVLLAAAWAPAESVATGAGSLLFVAVPVADTAVAVVRRARARRPLLVGDRGHIYDQLVDRGLAPGKVTLGCIGAQAVFVAIGVAIVHMPAAVAVAVSAGFIVTVGLLAVAAFTRPDNWML
jgi:UDP-GlcNAc:undecaprenyl-phosphate GlcNAc-1-phosphate transferase